MTKSKKKNIKKKNKIKSNKISKEIFGIIMIAFSLIFTISLFNYNMGIFGMLIRNISFSMLGFSTYLVPIPITIIGILFLTDKSERINNKLVIYISILILSIMVFLDGQNINTLGFINRIKYALNLSSFNRGGGLIGAFIGFFFYTLFGRIGGYIILFFLFAISSILILDINLKKLYIDTFGPKKDRKVRTSTKAKINPLTPKKNKEKDNIRILSYDDYEKLDERAGKSNDLIVEDDLLLKSTISKNTYKIPPLEILSDPISKDSGDYKKEILNNASLIEETMSNFGIDAMVTQINKGPTITCYELSPSPGIKLSKIVSLSDNIALSLASSDIRIEAPIPGKSAVGIEVPNRIKDSVYLKEILLSEEYIKNESSIPLALGKDVTGKTIVSSIEKMPHLLIAGATGSGKSVCINTIIMNILYKSSPDDVRLLLIDPKVVELNIYNSIPHLLIPVVTDAKKAASALKWAVNEMERRYKVFADNNVRDMEAYNKKLQLESGENLPRIIVIIDELADLMMVAPQEIEDYISRLAQMARAAGIYLIVATQRPSVDVITGTIKANIPSRISFAVSSQIDSRTILDMSGAEKLLGKGDMLFYPSFFSKPLRVQGAFVTSDEVEKVVSYLKTNYEVEYKEEIVEKVENSSNIVLDNQDELLTDAIELILEEGQASISLLQRRLRIGYARAARIIDELEAMDIVGGYEGSKPRKLLISKEDYYRENFED